LYLAFPFSKDSLGNQTCLFGDKDESFITFVQAREPDRPGHRTEDGQREVELFSQPASRSVSSKVMVTPRD